MDPMKAGDDGPGDEHLWRVRRLCAALPDTEEKVSHGAPAFFAGQRLYAMFLNNHHGDGHVAVWAAAPEGHQPMLIHLSPEKYFRPPYVGVKGWIGIELAQVDDDELAGRLAEAWRLVAGAKTGRGRKNSAPKRPY